MNNDVTIMYTDVVGYSKLTGDNQEVALEILSEHNKILFQNVKHYSGNIVKETGDGICALFHEPSDAVKCSIDIQKDLSKRNQLNIKERQIQIRIGLNYGSCVQENNDVFGDDINLTKEIESKAPHGGIAISQKLNDLIWDINDIYIREHMKINFNDQDVMIYEIYLDLISWFKNEKNQLTQIINYKKTYKKAHDFFHIGDYSSAIKFASLSLQNSESENKDEILSFICHTFISLGEFEHSQKIINHLKSKDNNDEKKAHILKMEGSLNLNKNKNNLAEKKYLDALELMQVSNKRYINEILFNLCLIQINNEDSTKLLDYIKLSNEKDENYKILLNAFILSKNNEVKKIDKYEENIKRINNTHLQSFAYYLIALHFNKHEEFDKSRNYIDIAQDLLVKSSENISDWFQRKLFLDNIILHKRIMKFSDQLSMNLIKMTFDDIKSNKIHSNQKNKHIFCTNCGHKNETKFKFCINCGNQLNH